MTSLKCFKAYDVRGRIPDEINEELAFRIGQAYAEFIQPKEVVVGYDIRLTSKALAVALKDGLKESGVNVIDIGQCGTEEVYFATAHLDVSGGICVTASHNPKDYNGMKFVREQSRPISADTGLKDIEQLVIKNEFNSAENKGEERTVNTRPDYVKHLLSYVDINKIKPLNVVCNAGNGGAGMIIDKIESALPVNFLKMHHNPDGEFPNGIPNPLLEENRAPTIEAVKEQKADLGIAWDGDFDRCFFFDENGRFIEGYYIVGLLADAFLQKEPGANIVHDPRLTWNTQEMVEQAGGKTVESKSGHAFMKQVMRENDCAYGGEMSAHHYFRDFFFCDSGMIPWLLVIEMISQTGKPLSKLVDERMSFYPCSGEINLTLKTSAQQVLAETEKHYTQGAIKINHLDGLGLDFSDWRFNLRASNTEPVVRLNVESRDNLELMQEKRDELLVFLQQFA